MTKTYDKGSAVLMEVEFKRRSPFGSDLLFNPTSASITITDEQGSKKIDAAAFTGSAGTGQMYYICQTALDWASGAYAVTIHATDDLNSDIAKMERAFQLR